MNKTIESSSEADYTLFGDSRSGNCYKAAWILNLTGRRYNWVEVDVMSGNTRTPEFLVRNPNGRVPTLQVPDGQYLAESNAMLLHLSEGSVYLPADAMTRARVYQWLFFEQYSHEPFVAVVRFIVKFLGEEEEQAGRLVELRRRGAEALAVMDHTLSDQQFLTGDEFTVADIALYAYTHVAEDGGFDLLQWPAVCSWLRRVEAVSGYLPMKEACC